MVLKSFRYFDLGWEDGFSYPWLTFISWSEWIYEGDFEDKGLIISSLICWFVPNSLPFFIFGNITSAYKFSNSRITYNRWVTRMNYNLNKKFLSPTFSWLLHHNPCQSKMNAILIFWGCCNKVPTTNWVALSDINIFSHSSGDLMSKIKMSPRSCTLQNL